MSFQAQHKEDGIFAALKQVEIKTEEDLEDFSVEIDILIACRHKNVVGLHEAFYHNGILWVRIEILVLKFTTVIGLDHLIMYLLHKMGVL